VGRHPADYRYIPWQHHIIVLARSSVAGGLAVPLYWMHQFEGYSLPTLGFEYSIQDYFSREQPA
jgi:hypothetical protein